MHKLLLATVIATGLTFSAAAERLTDSPLVDTAWLKSNLGNSSLVVIDIRADSENKAGKLQRYFNTGHIPGAINAPYGIFGWRAKVDKIVGQLPPLDVIGEKISSLGVDETKHVVIVPFGKTSTDFGAATRVYWTFKVLGHDEVSILDGGHAAWTRDGGDLSQDTAAPQPAEFQVHFRPELRATAKDVSAAAANGVALVDARPPAQFSGLKKSKVVRIAGTIPGSVNLPQSSFYSDAKLSYANTETVSKLAKKAGLSDTGPEITFCNTGHWASVAWFGLSEMRGRKNVSMYDGSMTEWASDPSRPVVK